MFVFMMIHSCFARFRLLACFFMLKNRKDKLRNEKKPKERLKPSCTVEGQTKISYNTHYTFYIIFYHIILCEISIVREVEDPLHVSGEDVRLSTLNR